MKNKLTCIDCMKPKPRGEMIALAGEHIAICGQCRANLLKAFWEDQGHETQVAFTKHEIENFGDALADANCWLEGFVAAGGSFSPQSQNILKELRIKLRQHQAKGD